MNDWSDFGRTLIGRWPQARWDNEVIVAYVAEAENDGLLPGESTDALRDHPGKFPPSTDDLRKLVMGVRARKREHIIYCGQCDDGWIVEGRTARACDCRAPAIRAAGGKPREVGEGRPAPKQIEQGEYVVPDEDIPF